MRASTYVWPHAFARLEQRIEADLILSRHSDLVAPRLRLARTVYTTLKNGRA